MFVTFQWILAKGELGPEPSYQGRPEEQCLYCLVDIDVATGTSVEPLLAQSLHECSDHSSGWTLLDAQSNGVNTH